MLKKIFAKLRDTLAPSPRSKPASSAGKPISSPSASSDGSRGRGSGTRRGERPARGGKPAQSGQGGKSRGGRTREGGTPAAGTERAPEKPKPTSKPASGRESRGGRGRAGQAKRGGRDERDSFEHPRSAPVKPATPVEVPAMQTAFSQLGLSDPLAYAVEQMGYQEPTPIQSQGIPVVLAGRDVIGSAQTGTGKTAAFALPILQRLGGHGRLRCLVLEPTRELALQVEEAFQQYSKYTDITATVVYGGVGYGKQREDLQRGVDVLAATPGRLLDHLEQGTTSLADVEILVLDEVDRMLDMGFLPDVKRIVQQCPRARQTLFFTATLPPEIAQLAGWALRDPVEVKIGQRRSPAETVAHAFYPVVASQKFELLLELLKQTDFKSVIVFTRTRMGADRIAHRLQTQGHQVGVLHSDRNQRERVEALEGFKAGRFELLVATDIAARGLDIAGVSHVINYDVPENPEDYVHRIGRTGRAQNTGDAFTLVTEEDVRDARSIERFIGAAIERKRIEGFPYIYSALFDERTAQGAAKPASRLHRRARR